MLAILVRKELYTGCKPDRSLYLNVMISVKKYLLCVLAVACLGFYAHATLAIQGTAWENFPSVVGGSGDATIINYEALAAARPTGDVTFNVPTDPLFLSSYGNPMTGGPTTDYTLASWLGTGGAFDIDYMNGAKGTDTMVNTLWYFSGNVFVTNGEQFLADHDDGIQFLINGNYVINWVIHSSPEYESYTYTGPTGTFPFQLVYAEINEYTTAGWYNPAVLVIDTLALGDPMSVPDGGRTLALLGAAFSAIAGLGALLRKRPV